MTSPSEVGDRLARWRQTGDPGDLWPGLEEADFQRAMDDVGRATRSVLQSPDAAEPLDCPFSVPPRALGVAAFTSGMGPLLGYWVETGRIRVDPAATTVLAEHLAQGRARAAMLDTALGRVLDAFAQRGIPAAVLKGMHTAWSYFPEPGTRPCADMDLLVAPQQLGAAAAALGHLGFQPGALKDDGLSGEWLGPSARREPVSLELTHRDDPWAVDLHASLNRTFRLGARTRFGIYHPEEGPTVRRGDRSIYVLSQPVLLAWLAIHVSSHLELSPLVRYLELVLVIRRDFSPHLGLWDELLRLAERTSSGRFLYPSLDLAERLASGSVPPEVRQRLQGSAPWLMRRVVPRLRPERVQQVYTLSLDVRIMWVGSAREVVAFLRQWLRPSGGGLRPGWRQLLAAQLRRLRLLMAGSLSIRAPNR